MASFPTVLHGVAELVLFIQHFPFDEHKIFSRFSTLVYAAIID